MKSALQILLLCSCLIFIASTLSLACTTFCIDNKNQPLFGRNFDWRLGDGHIFINKRDVSKTAISGQSNGVNTLLSWKSKYGSVTFNLFGREFPLGGMNEAGLVVESMMLDKTQYPKEDSRPGIMASQWIQYQLDNFSRVEEVIGSDSKMRVIGARDSKLHFLICEKSGDCAIIEFLDGRQIYHTREQMPVNVLTNSTYTESLNYLRDAQSPEIDETKSIERFIRTASQVAGYEAEVADKPIEAAFTILQQAENDFYTTQWSVVYDIAALTVHFRTHDNQSIRFFGLGSFDLSCSTPVKALQVENDLSGEIADAFTEYSSLENRNHIRNVYLKSYFSVIPADILDRYSGYPETTSCKEE